MSANAISCRDLPYSAEWISGLLTVSNSPYVLQLPPILWHFHFSNTAPLAGDLLLLEEPDDEELLLDWLLCFLLFFFFAVK